jgi:hypothetical protein
MKTKGKIKKLIVGLATVLALSSFGSCQGLDFTNNSSAEPTNEYMLLNKTINDFSDVSDLYQLLTVNSLGKIDLNKDMQYVKTGTSSAHITVGLENTKLPTKPGIKQRLSSKTQGYNYHDFTKVKKLKAQIYNPSEEVRTLEMFVAFANGATTTPLTFKLQKGWNDLIYEIDREMLSFQVDLEKAAYLQFSFEILPLKTYELYLDNISITQTNSKIQEVEMALEKDEICYFEKNYQKSVFYFWTWSTERLSDITDFGLTADPDLAKTGTSFYVTTKKGDKRWNYWYYLRFSDAYLKVIDWESLKPEDSIEVSVWVPDGNDGFNMDVNTSSGAITSYTVVEPDPNDPSKTVEVQKSIVQGKVVPKQWSTLSVKVADMITSAKSQGWVNEKTGIWDIFTGFSLHWGEFVDVEQKTYYFDDFRIVRGQTEEGGAQQ